MMLQFGHDFSAVETPDELVFLRSVIGSFNSATTFQPWKLPSAALIPISPVMLQFGHDFSAVETRLKALNESQIPLLQFGHDFSAVETWRQQTLQHITQVLQFGHDFSAVETG